MEIESLPESVLNLAQKYFELPLGGKKVVCPYFMNIKKQRAGLRVMVGKGSWAEIVHETKVWAQLKGFSLEKAGEGEIREFMMKLGIGIDCSGFVVYLLNQWMKELNKSSIWHNLKYKENGLYFTFRRFLRPVENISANLMTSELNCFKITELNDIVPGDLIRAKGKQNNAHHVALITKTYKDKSGNLEKFDYIHSHRFYEKENGVRQGSVEITKPTESLKDQKWEDHYNGKNYMLEDLLVDYEDNGVRRLKFLQN
ncbi:C40 family peptidase [Candidatus Dojkabacteria bacterium]|nr:C40 family peptidase [Candidatus Dojkabacteria bacterium]